MISENKPKWNNFNVFLVIALAGICLTPLLGTNIKTTPRIFQLAILILWYFDVVIVKGRLRVTKQVLFVFIWMLWEAAYKMIGISSATWSNIFQKEIFYSLIIIMLYMKTGTTFKQKKIIVWSIVMISAFNVIDNIMLCTKYPTANEMVAGGTEDLSVTFFAGLNIGTTMFGFITVLFSGIMLIIALNDIKFKTRIFFGLLSLCADYFVVFLSNRGITVLVWILMTALILFTKFFIKNSKNKLVCVTSIIAILIAANFLSVPILKWLIINVDSYRLQLRFNTLLTYMLSGGSIYIRHSSFIERLSYLALSWNTFINNFFNFVFGVGYPQFNDHIAYGVGSHSEIIDSLAKYGIIGGFFIFKILKNSLKSVFENLRAYKFSTETIIIMLTFLIYGLLNNVFTPEVGVIIFFLLPLSPLLIERKNN